MALADGWQDRHRLRRMSEGYVVREPRIDEAKALAAVHVQAWKEAYTGILPEQLWNESAMQTRVNSWRQMLGDQAHRKRTRVAELDGVIVGIAQVGDPREDDVDVDVELYMMYLLAEHQGNGTATRMLSELLGQKSASLWVLEDNPRAHAFYAKHGFAADGTRQDLGEDHGAGGLRGIIEIRMVRDARTS